MSRKDNLIKSKSIYTLRSKHTSVLNGTIYENDHVTIIRDDDIYDEDIPLFSESNFKFRIGRGNGERRKHSRGGWLEVDGTDGTIWTLNNLPISQQTSDTKIVLKPNYSSIKDFAYYGSAVELIRATVNDVIQRYPGGISYYKTAPSIRVDGVKYYFVSNEFNIDFWTPIGAVCDELENPMRVLGASYMNYEGVTYDSNGNEIETHDIGINICITGDCINSIIGRVIFTNNGTINNVFSNHGGDSDDSRNDTLLKSSIYGPDLVFGAGESDGNDRGFPQQVDYVDVMCYSGLSETNYLPNVPISDVLVTLTIVNGKGVSQTLSGRMSNINGLARFFTNEMTVGGEIVTIIANGEKNGHLFTTTYQTGGVLPTTPINLYIHFKDEILENNFPFTVYVYDCSTNMPIAGADVVIYAYLMLSPNVIDPEALANKPFYTSVLHTDNRGFVELWGDFVDWYRNHTSMQHLIEESGSFYITSWRAVVTYNGDTINGEYQSGDYTSKAFCFNSEEAHVPFADVSVNGIVGLTDPIGAGHNACLYFYNPNESITVNGLTDSNGRFSIDAETFENNYPGFIPVSYNCAINYNGVGKSGRTQYFIESISNPQSHSQTLYFNDNPTGTPKTLIATAYSEYNGVRTVLPGISVTFSAVTDKNKCLYTVTKTTNDHGVAMANIPNDGWAMTPMCNAAEMSDINNWYVDATIEGTLVQGQGQPNKLKTGDNTDIIVYQESNKWDILRVTVVDQNNNRLRNAYVTVCASTNTNTSFDYYTHKLTDENGVAIFTPSERWNRFNTSHAGNISDIKYWGCIGSYAGQSASRSPIDIYQWYCTLVITLKETPVVPPYPYVDDCSKIPVPEGFYIYLDGDGNKKLLTNSVGQSQHAGQVVIRPKSQFIEEFWSTLDDFEAVLLNRNTKPRFKAKLESPYILNNRHYYKYKNYVWPTVDGVNPDVTSGNFNNYLISLLDIATYYDEYDCDNLWRMMTHESIKNLDWSFTRNKGEDFVEENEIDYTRIQAALRVEARLFDDIKRYADNIKTVNNITYDEKNNIPDYFLSDVIELNGFESKNISRFNGEVSDVIYSATTVSGRTDAQVNSDFMRRLSLSSEYLMREKGTRRGIEGILGMFGYVSGTDYTINEYVAVAKHFPKYNEMAYLRAMGEDEHLNTDDVDFWMQGYPVALVYPAAENADLYLIPWIEDSERYLNNIYFQEKGGWGRIGKKDINIEITTASEIVEEYGFNIYGETEPYLTYVSDIEELKSLSNSIIYENMVCYVTDISNLYAIYSSQTDYNLVVTGDSHNSATATTAQQQTDRTAHNISPEPQSLHTSRDYSHYFVLKNTKLSTYVGFVSNELYHCYGWRNIRLHEFKNGQASEDGLRVLYLESLLSNNKGNNPHCGFGSYDDGESYIDKYNHLFGSALLTGEFDYLKYGSEEERGYYSAITESGFSVENYCIDNKKCHYFVNDDSEVMVYGFDEKQVKTNYNLVQNEAFAYTSELKFIEVENGETDRDVEINDGGYSGLVEDGGSYSFINPENGEIYEEAAANSVVNIKNILITFNTYNNDYFKKYLQNTVFTYLQEMIPSTTILRYKFNDGFTHVNISPVNGVSNDSNINTVVGDLASVGENDVYLIEDTESLIKPEK